MDALIRANGVTPEARSPSRVARLAGAVMLAFLLTGIGASPAAAHADFVDANPAPGTGLPQAPGSVTITFTEPLILDLSSIQVLGPSGDDVGEGPTLPVEGDPQAMRRRLGLLPPGQYQVQWITVSPLDGHTLRGSYRFSIGATVVGDEEVQAGPVASEGWLGLGGRLAALVGLTLWAGQALLGGVAAAAGVPPGRLRRLSLVGPALASIGVAGSLMSTVVGSGGAVAGVGALLSSQTGQWRAAIVAAGVAATLAMVTGRWSRPIWGALALIALVAEAASGHAAASAAPAFATASFAVHLGAAGVWLFAIVAGLLSERGLGESLRVFAPYAIRAGVVVAATGLANAGMMLEGPHDLLATGYGRTLALKAAAVAAMALAGWTHHRRRHRETPPSTLRRPLWAEVVAGGLVLLLATTLVSFPNPPGETAFARQWAAGDPLLGALAQEDALSLGVASGPYVLGLTVLPPRPGSVELRLQVLGVEPGDGLREVRLRARGPGGATVDVALDDCGRGCFTGRARLQPAGAWSFTASLDSNRGPASLRVSAPLPAPDGTGPLQRALQSMERLDTASVTEWLREEADGKSIVSVYEFQAPDAMEWRVRQGSSRIAFGKQGYIRSRPGDAWEAYEWSDPGFAWPQRFYRTFFEDATAVRVLGSDRVNGTPATMLTFVQPIYPAWYRVWLAKDTGRILRLEMRAERHVMDQVYSEFNEPVTIRRPLP